MSEHEMVARIQMVHDQIRGVLDLMHQNRNALHRDPVMFREHLDRIQTVLTDMYAQIQQAVDERHTAAPRRHDHLAAERHTAAPRRHDHLAAERHTTAPRRHDHLAAERHPAAPRRRGHLVAERHPEAPWRHDHLAAERHLDADDTYDRLTASMRAGVDEELPLQEPAQLLHPRVPSVHQMPIDDSIDDRDITQYRFRKRQLREGFGRKSKLY